MDITDWEWTESNLQYIGNMQQQNSENTIPGLDELLSRISYKIDNLENNKSCMLNVVHV